MTTRAAQAQRKQVQNEWNWEWLAPLGLLAVVMLLALNFVGARPFGLDNDRSAQVVELGLSTGALAIIAWGYWLTKQQREGEHRLLRDRMLVAIGFASFLAYFNFGHLHFNNFVHTWDTYHYYMGAKYSHELGYDRLYDCSMIADVEAGKLDEVKKRTITNLRNNVIETTEDLLNHPDERCKAFFSAERWAEYKRDAAVWRSWVAESRWSEIHRDHGYNATPVWTIMGKLLSNTGVTTMDQVIALDLLDPVYLALTLVMVWWAFGPRAFAMAALVMGCNFPNRFYWTGGSFLRHDWVFYFVASVCLLKKERPFLAGMAVAYATLLRLFPGLMILGPIIGAVEYLRVHKKLDPRFLRFVAGGVAATVVLLGISTAYVGGGLTTWKEFAANTIKHSNTPLTNHMGLRTVLSWRPDTTGSHTVKSGALDPWAVWKATRLEKWQEAKPLFFLLMFAAAGLVYLALRHSGPDPWLGAALGVGFIVFGAELTNYYYCFLIAMAVLYGVRREVGLFIAGMCAVNLILEMRPFPNMSGWLDEQYVGMTVATLIAIVAVWWAFTKWGAPICLPPEPGAVLFPHLAAVGVAPGAMTEAATPRRDGKKKKKK